MPRRFRHPCKQIGGVDDPAGLAAPAANLLPPLKNLSGRPARVFLIFHMGVAFLFLGHIAGPYWILRDMFHFVLLATLKMT